MEISQFALGILGVIVVFIGILIWVIKWVTISSTDGAIQRLEDETAKATAKQAELSEKLSQAEEALQKRQQEARELADKMRSQAEEEAKAEREKIVTKAREEGEEIIAKAQNAKEKLRQELEKDIDTKAVNVSMEILNAILSEKAVGTLEKVLIGEFMDKLKDIDTSKISSEIKEVEAVTLSPLDENTKSQLSQLINKRLGRSLVLKASTSPEIGGGLVLKFGSMALDGSIKNLIREKAIAIQQSIEDNIK